MRCEKCNEFKDSSEFETGSNICKSCREKEKGNKNSSKFSGMLNIMDFMEEDESHDEQEEPELDL